MLISGVSLRVLQGVLHSGIVAMFCVPHAASLAGAVAAASSRTKLNFTSTAEYIVQAGVQPHQA